MGATNQNFLCSPRVYYAMAKDGIFFKTLADVHPKFRTPHVSIIAMGIWSMILVLFFGTFENLFSYVIFGQWIFFGLTVAGVFILRKKRPDMPRPYKTWGYPVTPIIFILAALYISVTSLLTSFGNSMKGLAIILLGLPFYFFWKIKRQKAAAGPQDPMKARKAGDRWILRFETGDALIASIADFCRRRRIGAGVFSGIGSCRRAELGFFDPKTKKYAFKTFRGAREIAALIGNISLMDGRPFVHAHAVLAGRDYRAVAGHLREADILAAGEVVLTVLPGKLVRKRDEGSGTIPLAI